MLLIEIRPVGEERFFYIDRTYKEENVIIDNSCEVSCRGEDALKEFREDIEKYKTLWQGIHKRKLPSNTALLLEAVVKLNKTHTMADIKRVVKLLEKTLGVKVYQYALHRDEGIIKDRKIYINYHAHILFNGIVYDKENNNIYSLKKRLKKGVLSNINKAVAIELNVKKYKYDLNDFDKILKEHKKLTEKIEELQNENYELKREVGEYMDKLLEKTKMIKKLEKKCKKKTN